jgi:hypothetical protein
LGRENGLSKKVNKGGVPFEQLLLFSVLALGAERIVTKWLFTEDTLPPDSGRRNLWPIHHAAF